MYSPPRVGKEESDKSRSISKVIKSIDVCAEQNVNIGANGAGSAVDVVTSPGC